ncbi:flagellar filament capping protein FliD [Demequina zhanjiangensis]|uniref:Flagellar hook-associated protein 2 n=1 Tax=Demequina zhanjiangensis TaxID=3051659 RepID=A0ABT8FZY0_9MICO|nr:flagellar filament capping protein FliD [Demequina sp. SYSU T00b26]MDN4472383.1 flagellar filament capping protein FliD [Demequina sp. SYSU T00b26]
MPTLGIDGIISGMDTTSIISALMRVEAQPQALLQSKQSKAENVLSALQGINTKVASLASAAEKASDPDSWASFKATSSSDAVTATAGTTASAGSLSFTVDAVATSQVSLTAAVTEGATLVAENPPSLTFLKADGEYLTITPASNSLADIASAINSSSAGVTATRVQVSGGDTPSYRLQFASETTGADGAFELYVGDQAAVEGGTATRLDSVVTRAATDASLTLYPGTAAETTYAQSSNTFTGLMTGVNVTLGATVEPGDEVTISVATNASSVESLAKNLVSNLNTIFSDIASRTRTTSSTNDQGESIISAGLLGGDSAVRNLRTQLTQAASYPIDGASPSSYGISVTRDGEFEFDSAAFSAALADDPDGTAAFIQALGARIQETAESFSDSTSGSLSLKIQTQESRIDGLADQIAAWDDRLAMREATLSKQFTAMETALGTLNSQQSWLEQQISQLPSWNSSK